MSIYAIGDLHLSNLNNKPMNIFGDNWNDHEEKIRLNWKKKIKEEDLILLPGDFSWAMNLEEAYLDFKFLDGLPGIKLLLKGNHDYWWTTLSKMQNFIDSNKLKNIYFLINNSFSYDKYTIVGTRGWTFNDTENSEKMINRETNRLKLSIEDAKKNNADFNNTICIMHYPPITKQMISENTKSPYLKILNENNINLCLYGHLHGSAHSEAVIGNFDNVNLKLVSSDFLNFDPMLII